MPALPITSIRITADEYRQRCQHLVEYAAAAGASGVVLFDALYILYYTGFNFIPTERPIALVINRDGKRALFVPRLEADHAAANALIDHVAHYVEYPYIPHPTQRLRDLIAEMGITGQIAADQDGYPWVYGYRGSPLSILTGAQIVDCRAFIEDAMMIKSPAEIALVRESCKWGNLAHMLLQRYTVAGASETAVSERAGSEATRAMYDTLGPLFRPSSPYYSGAVAGYRGQIGRNGAIPHALSADLHFQHGDVLVTGAASAVWGYVSELERTMIIAGRDGSVTDGQKRLFDHMCAVQEIAFDAMQPGKPCAIVDQAVRAYYEQHDLMGYWRHHVGHAIGLRYHEAPFLDVGDQTIMQPGMIFTVEPGLYDPQIGGFRHSDTVLITTDGIELLTYYPRDLASLTLPG